MKFKSTLINDVCFSKGTDDNGVDVAFFRNGERIPESEYLKAIAEKPDEYHGEIGIEKKGWKLIDNDETAIIETADIKLFIPKEIFNEFVKFWSNKFAN